MAPPEPSNETLLDLFMTQVRTRPHAVATRHVGPDGVPVDTTFAEWSARSRRLAAGLVDRGLKPGARVALLSRTRVEWAWLDLAIVMAGGISVPIYPTELPSHCGALLRDSGARMAIAEDPWQLKKLLDIGAAETDGLELVVIEETMTLRNGERLTSAEFGVAARSVTSLTRLDAIGAARLERDPGSLDERLAGLLCDGCVTICYTPGTSGRKKGVMLTHENFLVTCRGVAARLRSEAGVGNDDSQLLYLPLAQSFARLALWVGVTLGIPTAFARSYRTVFEDCQTLTPTFLSGVPRLFEKTREELVAELAAGGGLINTVSGWSINQGPTDEPPSLLARFKRDTGGRLVRRRLSQRFGGKLRFALCGGAPLGSDTARFFIDHAIALHESYGMVETCAVTHVNDATQGSVGTVGRPLVGVEVALLEDGELLVRGPGITPGYWSSPDETREVIDTDGWFHTGDLATYDDAGRLIVTGRKRDIIVTANGKVIAPQALVERLAADPLIAQVLVHGDRRPFVTALFALKPEPLRRFAEDLGLEGDHASLTRHPAIFSHIEELVDGVNALVAPHSSIRKFAVLPGVLTVEAGDLTPTMRLRRHHAETKHRALLDAFYAEQF
ncbi:MAG: long-chain acyl-CoA synthetase [Myxococcota bacterium]|jgi:long-chain acyl-CoA synthetase